MRVDDVAGQCVPGPTLAAHHGVLEHGEAALELGVVRLDIAAQLEFESKV